MTKEQLIVVFGWLASLLWSSLTKYPTPEEFEAAPRWSSLRKLVCSLGIDGPRALEGINGVIRGSSAIRSATAEHVAALPESLRSSLPPLAEPKRIDSGLIEAVRPEGEP